ncbi:hypothetical protein F9L33_04510 [Amylibacter sp. SFDW26]|uniref:chalcone isomerase family protein n=1 Tax=Amylibacter sp. SFDW26 TaxID=2652722 RepID=UPI0012616A82|nr:chalcone isomerase family protein [Amylibacter sp. SFDW26]KAB7616030.1 hypothetical protein F9L33_04510 [Amylibacter sp. SFDW26]
MKYLVITLAIWGTATSAALSTPPEVQANLKNASLTGAASASILTKTIYDAELWSEDGKPFAIKDDFALSLTYKASFKASVLAWATVFEIARIEDTQKTNFDDLEQKLTTCFSDVKRGDRFTAMPTNIDNVTFFFNGQKSCDLSYPKLTERFFGIWLGPKTRDPKVSAKLKGVE